VLRSQIGLQLWKIWTKWVEINSASKTIRKNGKISAKERLFCIDEANHGTAKDAQNFYIRGNKLNCRGYRIQLK
jgi:hypothetical protein